MILANPALLQSGWLPQNSVQGRSRQDEAIDRGWVQDSLTRILSVRKP